MMYPGRKLSCAFTAAIDNEELNMLINKIKCEFFISVLELIFNWGDNYIHSKRIYKPRPDEYVNNTNKSGRENNNKKLLFHLINHSIDIHSGTNGSKNQNITFVYLVVFQLFFQNQIK